MTNEDKIVTILERQEKTLERLEKGQQEQGAAITRLEQGHAHHKTALEVLGASLQDLRDDVKTIQTTQKTLATAKDVDFTVEAAKRDIQADINTAAATLIRQVQSNTKRINNLEEFTGADNPEKH